jgi:two-component system CheB/CheR fusion protein
MSQSTDAEKPQTRMIVGIGAAAGGLESLERFFDGVDRTNHAAYVVIQHLSPNYETMMDSLLRRHTHMGVKIAEDGEVLLSDHVYVLPPKKEMTIEHLKIRLHVQDRGEVPNYPIDRLFSSLAKVDGAAIAAVVLSGTGSDGSRGIVDVHNAGGLVLAESEATAKFSGMPNAAFATGVVHETLPPEEMSNKIDRRLNFQRQHDPIEDEDLVADDDQQHIFRLLRDHCQINFNHYKPSTVMRRIDRRMKLCGLETLPDYVRLLQTDEAEVDTLYRDMLIGVTKFFRDPSCWNYLAEETLDHVIEDADPDKGVRVWIAGCATGEEAYSMAILLHEANDRRETPRDIKIFASDVHPGSLQAASSGVYRKETLSNVSADRLDRYFELSDGNYVISKKIRSMVVFTPHNVLQDPPFTDLDMVSCRNLLIYFDQTGQRKALSLFHFGLKKNGRLFLGPSESLGQLQDEFSTIDERSKLYAKLSEARMPAGVTVPIPLKPKTVAQHRGQTHEQTSQRDRLRQYDRLIDSVMPPSMLVNDQRKVLECFGGAEELLKVSSRLFSNALIAVAPQSLQAPLSALFRRAQKDGKPTVLPVTGVRLGPDESSEAELSIKPVAGRSDEPSLFLVSIKPITSDQAATELFETVQSLDVSGNDGEMATRIRSLETDLRHSRENLQATIEELESSNEELQATNEELISSNEELQSTNEELNSVNEELHTVNVEFQNKNDELREVNEDLNHLFASTDIGTVFLDQSLSIRRFTPRIATIFDLRHQDIGRPLTSFSHTLNLDNLTDLIRETATEGKRHEQEVADAAGNHYALKLHPYRLDESIVGVILTLTDISGLVETRELAAKYQARLQKAIDAVPVFVSFIDKNQRFQYANRAYTKWLKSSHDEVIGQPVRDVIGKDAYETSKPHVDAVLGGEQREFEQELQTKLGPLVLKVTYIPQRNRSGEVTGFYVSAADVTSVKRAEKELARAVEAARNANRAKSEFLAKMSHEIRSPMTAILGFADILDEQLKNPDNRNSVEIIRNNGHHLLDIINDILDLSKIESGNLELEEDDFDIRGLLNECCETIEERASRNQVDMKVTIDESIRGRICGDRRRLRQVVMNLLTNAVKFSAGKSVHLIGRRTEERFSIAVSDTGCGIPPEMMDHLFEPFCQADNSDVRKHEGTGLGLTICKQLIQQMDGSISVQSELDKGSTFTIELPWEPVDESDCGDEDSSAQEPSSTKAVRTSHLDH